MFLFLLAALVVFFLLFFVHRKNKWYRFDIWIFSWLLYVIRQRFRFSAQSTDSCKHVIFCFVDHFEPGTGGVDLAQKNNRFDTWVRDFPALASRFKDSDGNHPQHTFFFPPHYFRSDFLSRLSELDWNGYGEVEFHLHHSGDTSETLRIKIEETIESYSHYGAFLTEGDPVGRSYGFIHGNWALDNSRPEYCGVNDELTILNETGCYADFTFPSLGPAQPSMVNMIYRAKDDPQKPKSYNTGVPVKAGGKGIPSDLMLIPGPIGFRTRKKIPWFAVEDADVTGEAPGTPERVRNWVKTGIHILGRPEWIFVKVHTHGAVERHWDALLGRDAERMYSTLCEEFNDGKHYRLHFVTAREMYNIARAAECGMSGNPDSWRDFKISPYLSRSIRSKEPYRAVRFTNECFELHWESRNEEVSVEFKNVPVCFLKGALITAVLAEGELMLEGNGEITIGLKSNWRLRGEDGYVTAEHSINGDGEYQTYQCLCDKLKIKFKLIEGS